MGKLSKMKKHSKDTLSNQELIDKMDVVLKGELPEDGNKIVKIDISKIDVNPNNDYRLSDTQEGIMSLAKDIENNGLLHNLVVSKRENGKYIIISGERRFRALSYLFQKEKDNNGDVAKYRSVPCRVVEGLTERQEMIMLDAANLQARGGAGGEAHVRNAMIRYRDNVKAELNINDDEAKEYLIQIANSNFSLSSINSNIKIRDNLRTELVDLLDTGEITKRSANSFVKLNQKQQKLISDSFSSIKEAFGNDKEKYQIEFEKATEGFVAACEERTEAKIQEAIENTSLQVSNTIANYKKELLEEQKRRKEEKDSQKEAEKTKQEKQEAQRDIYLKKCNSIKKGLADLSKVKTISRIKEFDATTDEENRKVLLQINEIIKIAQALKDQLQGDING